MSTNRDVIKAALQMLTVLDADENPSAEDGAAGLRQLNNLFASLAADGFDLGWPPQDDLSEDFPLDSQAEAQAEPLLAMYLQPFYPSTQLPPTVPVMAARAMKQIARDSVLRNIEEADLRNIPLGESNRCNSNILTDE